MTTGVDEDDIRAFVDLLRRPLDALPDPLPMRSLPGSFHAAVQPPGSKSLTNRALVLASLCRGVSTLGDPLVGARDTEVMIEGLRRFGAEIERFNDDDGSEIVRVRGVGGRPMAAGELDLANAGTAVRFLTAVAALADGPTVIDGSDRMRKRPIGGLVAALRAMRVRVDFLGEYGFPPFCVSPPADGSRLAGGAYRLPPQSSSQFISALLLIAPWTREGIEIELTEPPLSGSYIRMTQRLLERIGAGRISAAPDLTRISVASGSCPSFDLQIEPDASGAAYFWAAASITPDARCMVTGLGVDNMQGDAGFPKTLATMGARAEFDTDAITVSAPEEGSLHGVEADLSDMPDQAMTLAVVACFAQGRSRLRGVRTLRLKECDRIEALAAELPKLGVHVSASDESITIDPPVDGLDACATSTHSLQPVHFKTYNDHRMAMSLALVGLRRPDVFIENPACVAKTYPAFWRDLATLYERSLNASACPAGSDG